MIKQLLFVLTINLIHGRTRNITQMNSCAPTDWSVPWTKIGQVYFAIISKERNWFDQEKICRKINNGLARLATPQNKDEIDHLTKVTKEINAGGHWLAGLRIAHERWRWFKIVNGSEVLVKMTATNWAPGEPTDRGRDDCVASGAEGYWGAIPCDQAHKAYCELRC